jgi:hypothetical protein
MKTPTAGRRRALELLASCRDGCTEALMLAHGFTVEMLADLVRAGLATGNTDRTIAGGRSIEVLKRRNQVRRRSDSAALERRKASCVKTRNSVTTASS